MKKFILVLLTIALVASSASVLAGGNSQKGNRDKAADDNPLVALYLYEKENPCFDSPDCWAHVEGGAWGKIKYNKDGSGWTFTGHGLIPGEYYTLISYEDGFDNTSSDVWTTTDHCNPWPGPATVCIDNGKADKRGRVRLFGGDNFLSVYDGEKIWLVPSDAVDCGGVGMTEWPTPFETEASDWLFEDNLVGSNDVPAQDGSSYCYD
jgi:hypothetical protein